jgi:hypothetical protein
MLAIHGHRHGVFLYFYYSTTANKHAEFVQHIFKHAEFFRVFAKLALRIFSACFV